MRITWRLALDRWRSDRRRAAREQPDGSETPGPSAEGIAAQNERANRLWRAIDDLPDKLRETIVLSAIQGYDVREVAHILGLPEGTVKSGLFLARKGTGSEAAMSCDRRTIAIVDHAAGRDHRRGRGASRDVHGVPPALRRAAAPAAGSRSSARGDAEDRSLRAIRARRHGSRRAPGGVLARRHVVERPRSRNGCAAARDVRSGCDRQRTDRRISRQPQRFCPRRPRRPPIARQRRRHRRGRPAHRPWWPIRAQSSVRGGPHRELRPHERTSLSQQSSRRRLRGT